MISATRSSPRLPPRPLHLLSWSQLGPVYTATRHDLRARASSSASLVESDSLHRLNSSSSPRSAEQATQCPSPTGSTPTLCPSASSQAAPSSRTFRPHPIRQRLGQMQTSPGLATDTALRDATRRRPERRPGRARAAQLASEARTPRARRTGAGVGRAQTNSDERRTKARRVHSQVYAHIGPCRRGHDGASSPRGARARRARGATVACAEPRCRRAACPAGRARVAPQRRVPSASDERDDELLDTLSHNALHPSVAGLAFDCYRPYLLEQPISLAWSSVFCEAFIRFAMSIAPPDLWSSRPERLLAQAEPPHIVRAIGRREPDKAAGPAADAPSQVQGGQMRRVGRGS